MAKTYLETSTVNHNFETNSYENVLAEINKETEDGRKIILQRLEMMATGVDEDTERQFNQDIQNYQTRLEKIQEEKHLLLKYPSEFPALYAMRNGDPEVEFAFRETQFEEAEIVTEAHDVLPKEDQLEMICSLDDGGDFALSVEPFDKAGEDSSQLKARIRFSQKGIDELNDSRLKQILEFCEKRGLSVYDIDLSTEDGEIKLDEKLALLTKRFLESRKAEDGQNPGPMPEHEDENGFVLLDAVFKDTDLNVNAPASKKTKNPMGIEDVRKEFVDFIEKDIKKTLGLSYFEHTHNIDKKKTIVFSLYDKPNRDNEKMDGLEDKNKNQVPTYSYRLYVSQDSNSGRFVFGYATPGGKKMDDTMAGDLIGIIKKTGATHINFSSLSNADKGVWMMACAEKGIVPIGISLNLAKAKAMVDAARKKLNSEEFIVFKRNLSEQMLENAAKKCENKEDKTFGLGKSELTYIESLKAGYDFENFRTAYDDDNGLYAKLIEQIDKGSRDGEKGGAITVGSLRAFRAVFDIYDNYKNMGAAVEEMSSGSTALTADERARLSAIPANKPMKDMSTAEFMIMYEALMPRYIKNAEEEIISAYIREDKRKIHRADNVVLNDVVASVRGSLNEINISLTRRGVETMTMPTEFKAPSFEYVRPDSGKSQPSPIATKDPVGKAPQNVR